MRHTHHLRSRQPRTLCLLCMLAAGSMSLGAPGCLDRPVGVQQPSTARSSIKVLPTREVDKIDLLFVIDNSGSMADKQKILADAVPDLLNRITKPDCVNYDTGERLVGALTPTCPDGFEKEFEPKTDIQIGIVSSSLELSDSDTCKTGDSGLLTRTEGEKGPGTPVKGKPFLVYNAENPEETLEQFKAMVKGVGENGCGYEASLESWYRFLVDPAPPATFEAVPCREGDTNSGCRAPSGPDQRILAQRRDFLRADSLVAVVMLTDENDCSIDLSGQGYLASVKAMKLSRGTAACDVDPNDPQCMPCNVENLDLQAHPECRDALEVPDSDYDTNLRCWDQKRRFGRDFLYPISRYVDGLTNKQIGNQVNPLFCQEPNPQDPTTCKGGDRPDGFVFLAGIVGVPWQDVANDPTRPDSGVRPAEQFSWKAKEYEENGIPPVPGVDGTNSLWNVILGETDGHHRIVPTVKPLDPLMEESVAPRSGTNPALGVSLAQPNATSPHQNPINGHEWNSQEEGQLQFACVFDLPTTIDCTTASSCDCRDPKFSNPLCQHDDGSYGTEQLRAKAYPGTRHLAVLKGLGSQGIVSSICPSSLNMADPHYGYGPAVAAIVDRLAKVLAGTCWDERLEPNDKGEVPCVVLEATRGEEQSDGTVTCPPCEGVRGEPTSRALAIVSEMDDFKVRGMHCLCEVAQADADTGALRSCIEQGSDADGVDGWCYTEAKEGADRRQGALAQCAQSIRLMGNARPQSDSVMFIQCRGASF